MKNTKVTALIMLFVIAIFTKSSLNASVYSYWEGDKKRTEIKNYAPKPNVNYSVTYCSRNDKTGHDWNNISSVCKERGVTEHIAGNNKIWVGFQHGKQDQFFDNLDQTLAYVFDKTTNGAHWDKDVYGKWVYFNSYGLRYGQKNQRNQWYGKYEFKWYKTKKGKWMYQMGDYYATNQSKIINGKKYTFDNNGYMK